MFGWPSWEVNTVYKSLDKIIHFFLLSSEKRERMNVEKTLKKKPPDTPSQVFLGETIDEKGVLPINAPVDLVFRKILQK